MTSNRTASDLLDDILSSCMVAMVTWLAFGVLIYGLFLSVEILAAAGGFEVSLLPFPKIWVVRYLALSIIAECYALYRAITHVEEN